MVKGQGHEAPKTEIIKSLTYTVWHLGT